MTNIEQKVKECIEHIINSLDYDVYDVIYEKEGQENYLRIFIDKKDGISLNDCEKVNNAITDVLDEKDIIKSSYMLEVSSPGIEKRIRDDSHLEQNIGNKIEVHTFKSIESQKILTGILKEFDDKSITIELTNNVTSKKKKNDKAPIENKIINIEKTNISTMKTVYDWDKSE